MWSICYLANSALVFFHIPKNEQDSTMDNPELTQNFLYSKLAEGGLPRKYMDSLFSPQFQTCFVYLVLLDFYL